jgi:hypothetical protein
MASAEREPVLGLETLQKEPERRSGTIGELIEQTYVSVL